MHLEVVDSIGSLTGAILIGLNDSGDFDDGDWLIARFDSGTLEGTRAVNGDSAVRGRVDLVEDGDDRPIVDLRLAVRRAHLDQVFDDPISAVADGLVSLAGDESFFIRYMPEILTLLSAIRPGAEDL